MIVSVISEETLTPEEYLRLSEQDKINIKSLEIVPPKLGQGSFGCIKVYYRYPVLRPKDWQSIQG